MDAINGIGSSRIEINRDIFTQENFDEKYESRFVDFSITDRLRKYMREYCNNRNKMIKRWCITVFPPLEWMKDYNWKGDLVIDLISGLTVGVMNIPQGMAYGMLAGLPPVYGLYTSFYLPLIYCFFGTSLHMSVGVFAVISLMVATAVDGVAPLVPTGFNSTDPANYSDGSSVLAWFCGQAGKGYTRDTGMAVDAAVTLTFLVGIIQLLFGLLHMGFLSVYLSDQLVEGLSTGSAVLVFTSQMGNIFGIRDLPQCNGIFGIIKFYGCFISHISNINWASVAMSTICIVFLFMVKEYIDPPLRRKFHLPVPSELLVLIFGTIVSHYGYFENHYHMKIVGEIPTGLTAPQFPKFSLIPQLLPYAISTSVVIFSIGVSIGKLFGKKHGYEVKANQEWFAYGLCHLFSSFFSCHCGGSSLSRSVLQEEQGSKSQIASLFGALVILAVLLALGPLFQSLPSCVLGSIIVVNLKGMFMLFKKLPPLWKQNKTDFMVWIVALFSVIFLDIGLGLAVAVLYALLNVVVCSQWPDSICLGRLPGTELYKGLNAYKNAIEIPGVKIYRFESNLYFANADMFRTQLNKHTGIDVVKEKYKRKRKMAKRKNVTAPAEINIADICREEGLRVIIIDCSPFPYVDMTGLEALRQVYEDYAFLDIKVAFAYVKVAVRQMMASSNFFQHVPKSTLFPSVHDAVCALASNAVQSEETLVRVHDEYL